MTKQTERYETASNAKFVADLMGLAFPRGRGVLVTIGIYLDKAGPDDRIQAVTVAGVIMDSEQVPLFTQEWDEALYDFEELPFFHMSEYESDIGLYADWLDRGVKAERLGRLIGIMEKYVMATVGVSVSLDDATYHYGSKDIVTGLGVCATHLFTMVPQWAHLQRNPTERVVYTFEDGDEGRGKLIEAYDKMYANPSQRAFNRLGGKLETGRKDHPALQAADIVAFEGWKQWSRVYGEEKRATRKSFTILKEAIPNEWATLQSIPLTDLLIQSGLGAVVEAMREQAAGQPMQVQLVLSAPLTLPSWD